MIDERSAYHDPVTHCLLQPGIDRPRPLCRYVSYTSAIGGADNSPQLFFRCVSFSLGALDGANPYAGLIQASDGNFYGTTQADGLYGEGTVYKITPNGQFTVLHAFNFNPNTNPPLLDGAVPHGSLIQASIGNFYGTTRYGGQNGGTIFKITPQGVETVLYRFSFNGTPYNSDGFDPHSALIEGSDGNFYGTAFAGGTYGYGTVFKITPQGEFTTLHSFIGYNQANPALSDGCFSATALVEGSDGNFYGTTSDGSGTVGDASGAPHFSGTFFRITPQGVLTVLYSLEDANIESGPRLVQGSDGNFCGVGYGYINSVFQLTPNGVYTDLCNIPPINGNTCVGGLIQASDGNFYGPMEWGGLYEGGGGQQYGNGTIIRVTPSGVWTAVYSFTGSSDGYWPVSPLVQGNDGDFYGVTLESQVSPGNYGTIFRLHLITDVVDVSSMVQVSSSGLVYNRGTGLFTGTVKIANIGGQTINGPIQAILTNLTTGVTLTNATGTTNGGPYLTATVGSLAPGTTVTLPVQFSNPGNGRIGYTVTTYSGSF